MKKKINWNLIANITTIISMIAVLIGFIFMANKVHSYKERIEWLEFRYKIVEQDLQDFYEIDPGIRIVE